MCLLKQPSKLVHLTMEEFNCQPNLAILIKQRTSPCKLSLSQLHFILTLTAKTNLLTEETSVLHVVLGDFSREISLWEFCHVFP